MSSIMYTYKTTTSDDKQNVDNNILQVEFSFFMWKMNNVLGKQFYYKGDMYKFDIDEKQHKKEINDILQKVRININILACWW